jgi:hypothetical protein
MSRSCDWVDLHEAARRLSELWLIPRTVAEHLVHNEVESCDVLVRGIREGGSIITPEIAKDTDRPLLHNDYSLFPRPRSGWSYPALCQPIWRSLEINWPELRDYVPQIMPSWIARSEATATELRPAPADAIREAIAEAYDSAEGEGRKPPNIKELPAAVHPLLEAQGYQASGRHIMKVGDKPEFKNRRVLTGIRRRSQD